MVLKVVGLTLKQERKRYWLQGRDSKSRLANISVESSKKTFPQSSAQNRFMTLKGIVCELNCKTYNETSKGSKTQRERPLLPML